MRQHPGRCHATTAPITTGASCSPCTASRSVTTQNVDIPPGYFLGFSASTGDLSDNHDIVSVRVRGEVGAKPEEPPKPASDGDAPQVGEQPELPTPGVEEQKEGDTNEDAGRYHHNAMCDRPSRLSLVGLAVRFLRVLGLNLLHYCSRGA